MQQRILIVVIMACALAGPAVAQSEGGSTSGADFLLSPPATRTDSMGGALDAFGDNLDMILLNPALLTTLDNFMAQVNISPLQNSVTNAAISAAVPIGPGVGGAGVHFLNIGEFTYYDPFGQASSAESVYDAALSVGYSYPVWRTVSAGVSLKGIYRVLGSANAAAFAGDVGGLALVTLPYVGQPPVAPTYAQIEADFQREQSRLEAARDRALADAEAPVAKIEGQIESARSDLAGIEERIAAEEASDEPDAEAIESLRTRLGEKQVEIEGLEAQLETATSERDATNEEIRATFAEDLASATSVFEGRVAYIRDIERERDRLFAVIDDPEQELEFEMIDANIADSISKTNEYRQQRIEAFTEAERLYRQKRATRSAELESEIVSYREQIEEELGPESERLAREIEQLDQQISSLEASVTEENKSEVSAQIKELSSQRSELQRELENLQSDPWIRRLQRRISDKLEEISAISEEVEEYAAQTERSIAEVGAQADRDIERFGDLGEELKKELKRAKLKRELDIVNARTEQAEATAQERYLETETRIYQRLLAAMYSNEEKILQARLAAVRLDSETRRFDAAVEYEKSRELLEEDFAFQERLLKRRIATLEREESDSETESAELADAREELLRREQEFEEAIDALDSQRAEYLEEETRRVDTESATVRAERTRMRLIFLQTDEPYRNASFTLAVRNLGTPVKFTEEGFPMPALVSAGLSYTILQIDNHVFRLSVQADLPLLFSPGVPFYQDIAVGVGGEYTFFDLAYIRAGYTFNSLERNFAAGFGMKLGLGFTEYAVDYTFRPLPDFGFAHSFGVSISF